MLRFLVALSAAAVAFAQLTVNTPQGVLACTNQQINWTGGTGPYILQVQPGGDTSAAALETFTGIAAPPYTWHVIEPANTQVFLRLHDNAGLVAESGTFTIQSAGSTTCSSSSVVGGTTDVSSSSSGAVVPPVSSSSTPPAVGGSSSTTTPTGNSSGSSSSHSTSSTSTTGGASAAHVAGGLVGLVGAVAVVLA